MIESYIHVGGKVGVLIEVNCETDFVARNDEFKTFVRDLCLQIAAASPLYVSREQVPEAELAKEREIAAAQVVGNRLRPPRRSWRGSSRGFTRQSACSTSPS